MRLKSLSVTTVLISFLLVSSALAAEQVIATGDLDKVGLFKYWDVGLRLDRGSNVTTGYLVDDTIYVVTARGNVHALHAGVGLSRWALNLTRATDLVFEPTHFADFSDRKLTILGAGSRIAVVDRYDAELVADLPMSQAVSSSVIGLGDMIYFGSQDGATYAMIWDDPVVHRAVQKWRVAAGGVVTAKPYLVNEDNDLVFASQGGSVFSCTAEAKILNWEFKARDTIKSDIIVTEDSVYVASEDRSVYRLDVLSGVPRWRTRLPATLHDHPALAGGVIFQHCDGVGMVAIDAESGKILWKNSDGHEFLCRGQDRVYMQSKDGRLVVANAVTGKTMASMLLPNGTVGVRNTVDEALYLLSPQGRAICAKPKGMSHLRPADVARAYKELRRDPDANAKPEEADKAITAIQGKDEIDLNDPLRSSRDR